MTTKEDILFFIRENKIMLEKQFHVEKIALFGSFARNEQKDTSDIDLLVTLKKDTTDIFDVKQGLKDFFGQHFHCNVDIASEKYLKSYIRDEVLREAEYV